MRFGNAIMEVSTIGRYRLRSMFKDGYVGEIDLAPLFENPRGPLTADFKDPALFAKAYVDHRAVAWPNGYDIDPDVLRYYCEAGRVCSYEELAAVFETPDPAAMTLHDKPKA
jgi:hypothetical protein